MHDHNKGEMTQAHSSHQVLLFHSQWHHELWQFVLHMASLHELTW